jgi:ComF family protein
VAFADFLFPKRCLACGKNGAYICPSCLYSLIAPKPVCFRCRRPSIDGMTHLGCKKKFDPDGLSSLWPYTGVIRRGIIALKYKFGLEIARELANYAGTELEKRKVFLGKNLVLAPVPIHRLRGNWRGFNQTEEVGRLLAQKMGWGFSPNLLIRKKAVRPQTELRGKERLKNIKGVFSLNPNYKLRITNYQSLILFDDVLTTGATLKEATKVLKRGGAGVVWGLTIAR